VDASAGAARLPNGGASLLGRLYAGALPLHPHTDDATGGVIDYLRTQWGTDHLAASNPHGQYLTTIPSEYLTQDEGDLRYLPLSYVPPASGISQADADLRYVNTAGDTMTGALSIAPSAGDASFNVLSNDGSAYSLYSGTPTGLRGIAFGSAPFHLNRWRVRLSAGAETGSNAGSNFAIERWNDAGGYLADALTLSRATGAATFGGDVVVNGGEAAVKRLSANGVADLVIGNGGGNIKVEPSGAYFTPTTDNVVTLGHPALRWANLHATDAQVAGKPVAVSPTAGNALTWDATGFYVPGGVTGLEALEARVAALEAQGT
jgi:hypothetical protein